MYRLLAVFLREALPSVYLYVCVVYPYTVYMRLFLFALPAFASVQFKGYGRLRRYLAIAFNLRRFPCARRL